MSGWQAAPWGGEGRGSCSITGERTLRERRGGKDAHEKRKALKARRRGEDQVISSSEVTTSTSCRRRSNPPWGVFSGGGGRRGKEGLTKRTFKGAFHEKFSAPTIKRKKKVTAENSHG